MRLLSRLSMVLVAMIALSQGRAAAQGPCDPPPTTWCDLTDGVFFVEWGNSFFLGWQPEIGYESFNLYRGRMKGLLDADHNGVLDAYGTCLVDHSWDNRYFEFSEPPLGDAYIYIATGNGSTEDGFGAASIGLPRPNASPCMNEPGRPTVESFEVIVDPTDGQTSCDVTQIVKGWFCANGVSPDLFVPFPTLTFTTGFTEGRLEARITDPENTPLQSDIVEVQARFRNQPNPEAPALMEPLADDGGSAVLSLVQQINFELPLDCDEHPVCPQCTWATYQLTSLDPMSRDDSYRGGIALLTLGVTVLAPQGILPSSSRLRLVDDCILESRGKYPYMVDFAVGHAVPFDLEVRDRSGHFATLSPSPTLTVGPTTASCSGDECACCILLSANPSVNCNDRPGLVGVPGSGIENGFCVDAF